MAAANYKQIAAYVTPRQHAALKRLSDATRVPIAAYLREAVTDLLAKHAGAGKKGGGK